ncbi:MAG TPA: gliding motility-associated C-terminal domain-containing protein [Flavobacteriales bacterium]
MQSAQCGANFTQCFGINPTVQVITPICPSEVDRCNSTSGTYGVQKYTYTRIVDLSAYAACGGNDWVFNWSLCCRNNAITSLVNPGDQDLYLEARMNNTNNYCNNSPTFSNAPTPFYCLGQQINYTPGAIDPDGDSLAYALVGARGANGNNLTYANNYSATQPIRTTGGANAVVLNPATGTMTATPSQQQVSVVTYRVREYRAGVLVGETTRDVQFVVRACAGNNAPTATGINGTNNYSMQVCAGTPVNFTINSADANAGQAVTMTWNSGIVGATFTTAGAPFPTGTFSWTPTVADIGNHVFTVSVQDNGCPLVGTNAFGYSIQVTPPNSPVDAGPDQSVCGPNATLAASFPYPGLQGTWTVVSGSGNFANAASPTTAVSGLSQGANVFRWTVDFGTCGTSNDLVTVTSFNPAQASANAGPDQELCLPTNSATLAGNNAAAPAVGTWTLVSGSGTITAPNSPTSGVTNLGVGVNRFRWTIDNGPCAAPSQDEVRIVVYSNLQTAAAAGPDQSICTPANSVTLTGNALIGPATGLWTLVSGSGTITTPAGPSTTITGLPVGVHVFRWTISNGPCTPPTTQDEVTVTVFSAGSPNANAGPDQQICGSTTATLAGSVPTAPAVGTWTVISGSGVFSDPNAPNTSVSGLGFGNNVFQWSVNNGPCANGSTNDQITITRFDPSVNTANAGPDQQLCTPTTAATMSASSAPPPASGLWTLVSGSGTIADPTSPTTSITGLAVGANTFRWTVSNGPCPVTPPSDEVTIFLFDANAPLANAGPDQQLCTPTTTATLAGNTPTFPATGLWTLVSGTATITTPTSPTSTITGMGVGPIVLRWTINNGSCANPLSSDEVTITLFNSANPVANAGPDQQLCTPNTNTALTGSTLIGPATGVWTLVSGSGSIVSPNTPATQVTGLGVGDNIFRWTVSNGPCANGNTQDEVLVRVFDANNPAANAGPDQSICSTAPGAAMAGSSLIFPATGTWTLVSGSGTITAPTSPTTTITGLGLGNNVFAWTVNNGACATGGGTDQVTITVFDATVATPNAGPDQSICIPSFPNTVTMAASAAIFPATGQWNLVSGSGTITSPTSPTTTITGMAVGVNVFQWSISNGPCPLPNNSDVVSVFVYDAALPPANAGPDQALCTPITSTQLSGSNLIVPATGTWTLISGSGTITDPGSPTSGVTGLGLGNNVFQWEVNNGPCSPSTTDQVTISIFNGAAQQAQAGPDQDLCDNAATATLAANPATGLATAQWSVVSGTATITDPLDPNTTVTGLGVGSNVLAWTIDNGACGTSVDQLTLRVFDDASPAANAGPDQQVCTPNTSATLAGNAPIFPATGQWVLVGGTGNIVTPNSPTSQVTGLGLGNNVFRWTLDNGPCPNGTTQDEVTIVVFSGSAQAANAGPDQDLCTAPPATITITGNAPVAPATGHWSVGSSGTAVFADANSPTTTVTGLSVGDNILVWTIDNGICGSTSDEVRLRMFDNNNPIANAGPDQQLCTPNTGATMAGSANIYPASGTWTLISGNGTITDPNSPTTTITDMPVGVNVFRWTVSNGPCETNISFDQVTITVYDNSVSGADAGPDRELCTPTTSLNMTASAAPFPAVGTWTLEAGSGIIADVNSPTTAITGLAVGENIFRWSVTNGACPVNPPDDVMSIFVFDGDADPADAGPDQEICTPASTVQLAGNAPVFPATGQWVLLQGSGVFADATDPNTEVSGLTVGENIFQWTLNNGPCADPLTRDVVSIFVFDANAPVANAGPDQELCTPDVNANLNGSALIFPATGTWTWIQGSGTITDPTSPTTTVTGLGVGENILRWTVSNGPCEGGLSFDQVSLFVFDAANLVANAGPDQDLCTPQNSTTLSGSPVIFPAVGTWSIQSGTATITSVNDPNTTVTGLGVGAVVLVWTVDNGPCGNSPTGDEMVIQVFDAADPVANAGPDQAICTPASTVTMAGSSVTFPAAGQWTLVSGNGNIVDPTSPTTAITDLPVGTHVFRWTVDNGPCANGITQDEVTIEVFDTNNPVANAGADQDLCTPTTSAQLLGSALIGPATGLWTVVTGTGTFVDATDPNTTVNGLQVGTTVLRWTVDNGPCESGISFDQMTITLFDQNNPIADAGTDQELCTPNTSTVMAGSNLIGPATGQWVLVTGTGDIADPASPITAITGLSIGENVFQWSVSNGPCADPNTVDLVTITVYDSTIPVANAGPDQGVCTPLTSTALSGSPVSFPAVGTWTVLSGQGTFVDANDPNTEVVDLGIGANQFVWTVDNGACGAGITSDAVTITLFDLNAPPANAGADQEFCAPFMGTTLTANTPTVPSIGIWSTTQPGVTFTAVNNPASGVNGLQIGETVLTWTIDNGVCGVSSDDVSIFVFDPENLPANAGPDQEYCMPQDSTFLQGNTPTFPASGAWTVAGGAGLFEDATDPNTKVVGLAIGANTFVWTTDNGPCPGAITSDTITVVLYSDSTQAAFAGDDIETCLPITMVQLDASVPQLPTTGVWSFFNGPAVPTIVDPSSPTSTVTGLAVGITQLVWNLDNGPCPNNGIMSDTVSIYVYDPSGPIADAGPDIELCTPVDSTVMAANTPLFPGVGTWSLVSGSGTIADVNDPTTEVTALGVGENVFVWYIYNGQCATGPPTTDTVRVYLNDASVAAAAAGPDQAQCTPNTSTVLAGNAVAVPAIGTWSVVSGPAVLADASDAESGITGLPVGITEVVWTVDNGACGTTGDTLTITIYDDQAPDAAAGDDQQVCSTAGSGTTFTANPAVFPGTGQWTLVSGSGDITDPADPLSAVSGLALGSNVFMWTIENGPCGTTSDQVTIVVYDGSVTSTSAGPDQEFCTPTNTAIMAATPAPAPAMGSWSIVSGGGSFSAVDNPTATYSFAGTGTAILVWSVSNGPCTAGGALTDTVVVSLFDSEALAANAGADQSFCSADAVEVTMSGINAMPPGTGIWNVTSGSATIVDPTDGNTQVIGIGLGTTELTWTVDNGACGTTSDIAMISVYDPAEPPARAGEDQLFCHDTTTTRLQATAVITTTATGQWTLISGSGTIADPSDHDTEVSDLALGDNVFVWKVSNGACGTTSDTVVVHLKDCSILVVPDAYSPNGDGVNDTYVVQGLEYFPQNTFQVFNRWGSKVLDRKPYRNDWDGRSENSLNWGEELPESTYYFILDPGNGKEVITGYIYLRR